MQTRPLPCHSFSSIAKRVCALLCAAFLIPAATACSAPRIEGKAEAEQQQSPCEKAYHEASINTAVMLGQSQHAIRRYFAAQQAISAWTNTAANCPARFAEGTLRSAQARHTARFLTDRIAAATAPATLSRFDNVESLDVDAKSLSKAAQAEDQAGFIMEVLAARSISHATLDISDRHKVTSQRLSSFSGATDKRRKTYDITKLIANPDTITDPATGIEAPTDATVEMNCARGEISAIAASSNAANGQAKTPTAGESQSAESRTQSLGVLAGLIADRAELAFDWGYPTFDEALFR